MLRFILKKRNWRVFILLSLSALVLTGCQGKDAAEQVADVEPSSEKVMEEDARVIISITLEKLVTSGFHRLCLFLIYSNSDTRREE